MYNSFGVIQNNIPRRLTVRHRVPVSYHRHSLHRWVPGAPLTCPARPEEPRPSALFREALGISRELPGRRRCQVLPVLYGSVAGFLSRSQQVQNKVTTRFNKLIYICLKMYNAHCLIQGSGYPGASIYTCTDLRQQMSEGAGRAAEPEPRARVKQL